MSWKKDHQGKYFVIGRNCLLNFPEGFVLMNESITFLETKSFELFQNWNAVFCHLKRIILEHDFNNLSCLASFLDSYVLAERGYQKYEFLGSKDRSPRIGSNMWLKTGDNIDVTPDLDDLKKV